MRSIRLVAGVFLGAVLLAGVGATAGHADTEPEGEQFSIGPASARQEGESGTLLFPVFANALADQHRGAEPDFFAYCIERNVRARFSVDVEGAPWSQFPGRNRFTDNPGVQRKVAWIINNSYPALDLEELGTRSGIETLTAREAIAGTQHAIWYFTDASHAKLSANATKLRTYLTGRANVGLPEGGSRPDVHISVAQGAGTEAGAPVGPLVVTSNVEPILVRSDGDHQLLDAEGEPLAADSLRSGETFYFDVPAGAGAGSTTVHARVDAAVLNGSILKVPAVSERHSHAQTLILVRSELARDQDSVEISWGAAPPTVVGPVVPGVHRGSCAPPGEGIEPFLVIQPTYGIQYDYPRDAVYVGGVVPITAIPADGFEIGPTEGWLLNDDGTASIDLHIPPPDCPAEEPTEEVLEELPGADGDPATPGPAPPPAPADEPPAPELPETGGPSTALLALAGAALMGGLAALMVARGGRTP